MPRRLQQLANGMAAWGGPQKNTVILCGVGLALMISESNLPQEGLFTKMLAWNALVSAAYEANEEAASSLRVVLLK
jgi:hypothetical protein